MLRQLTIPKSLKSILNNYVPLFPWKHPCSIPLSSTKNSCISYWFLHWCYGLQWEHENEDEELKENLMAKNTRDISELNKGRIQKQDRSTITAQVIQKIRKWIWRTRLWKNITGQICCHSAKVWPFHKQIPSFTEN